MKPIPIIVGVSFAFCTLFAAALVEQRLGPIMPGEPITGTTNSRVPIDIATVTNAIIWETPKPSKVTIWFRYQTDFRRDACGLITTNIWPVTLSNATQMVLSHLKTRTGNWQFITLTGIWRDE